MVSVTLEDAEARILRETLESFLSDLRMEIADTDLKDFRDRLKARRVVLEKIAGRLPAA